MGSKPKPGKRNDIDTVRSMIKEGADMKEIVEEVNSYQAIRFAETYLKYNEKKRREKPHVTWIWGKSGTGKTKMAYELLGPDAYEKDEGKWWDGYDGQEDVIIDDYRPEMMPFRTLLKLLDRYPVRIECKGGSRQFNGKRIVITAPKPPEYYVPMCEEKMQITRRIDIVTSTEVGGNTDPNLSETFDFDFEESHESGGYHVG